MLTALHAAWVFPVSRPAIQRGYVTLDGRRVVDVGESAASGAKIIDLGNVALLPKPINAHTHLEFSDLEKPLGEPRQSFAAWIAEVLALRANRSIPKSDSIQRGLEELYQVCAAGVGEIATLPSIADDYAAPSLSGIAFHELLSTDVDRGLARLLEITTLADNWPHSSPLHFGLSPHAPYTVHWQLLQTVIDNAAQRNWPVAMHLGESLEELELLASHSGKMHQLLIDRGVWNPAAAPRGIRLADYLTQLAKAPRALAIHGNFFGEDEHEILARHRDRMSLVICPRTCDYFLPRLPPIAELLAKGVHIAIGTDSRATNPDLCVWKEAKFLLEKATEIAPAEILRLVTLSGSQALGLGEDLGRIAPGVPVSHLAQVQLPSEEIDAQTAIAASILGELSAV